MAEVNNEPVNPQRPEDNKTKTIDLNNFELNGKTYLVDVHQKDNSRFVTIHEGEYLNRYECVAIPMSMIPKFVEKLQNVSEFINAHDPKKSPEPNRSGSIYSVPLVTPGGRRYYLDIKVVESDIMLRISYVFNERRNVVQLVAAAACSLTDLVANLVQQYPSLTEEDDYPAPARRRFQGPQQRGRPYRVPYSSGYSGRGGYKSGGRQQSNFNGDTPAHKEGEDPKRNSAMKVVTDPKPTSVTNNAKTFTCEIVEGTRTFLRITELINETRKSTLHIPIEACLELQSVIGKMNQRYSATKEPEVEGNVA